MLKKIALIGLIYFFMSSSGLMAQNKFIGNWMGSLNIPGMKLRLVFKVSENTNGSIKAIMNSPDQTDKDFPADTVIVDKDSIKLFFRMMMGHFDGVISNDTTLSGKWFQGNMSFPLDLYKTEKISMSERPQNPKKPYPYKEEEVTFKNNSAGNTLAGTLTYPENGSDFPVVILITGSGPQDRDETVFRHKPFLVLSDYLTRNGIAVLRFDDRGIGKSTGNYSAATSLDFSTDVVAAINYIKTRKEIDKKKIGLIGHSEGGMIAPMVASQNKDVAFIVLMAGPGIPGKDILLKQTGLIMKAAGVDSAQIKSALTINKKIFDIVTSEKDSAAAYEKLSKAVEDFYNNMPDSEKTDPANSKDMLMKQTKTLLSPWMKYFLSFDPAPYLRKIKIPLLAVNGANDLQVPADDDLSAIDKYMKEAKNKNYKTIKLPNLNHLFQTSTTGAPSEYVSIEETIAPVALQTITNWIKEQTKR